MSAKHKFILEKNFDILEHIRNETNDGLLI